MKILIFGGTGEARELADRLIADGHDITSSLAGVTLQPLLPEGNVRIGGFGDVPRLRAYLKDEAFALIIDATHPFAEKMSNAIAQASADLGLPLIRLCRPAWQKPEGATWITVHDLEQAYDKLPPDAVLLVTIGQKVLGPNAHKPRCKRVIRLIELPERESGPADVVILDRPPFTVENEKKLMQEHGITHLLTKNSGGDQTRAKIDAAAALNIPVLMIPRPALPPVAREVDHVDAAIALVQEASSA